MARIEFPLPLPVEGDETVIQEVLLIADQLQEVFSVSTSRVRLPPALPTRIGDGAPKVIESKQEEPTKS
jgi:hypothetical protein